MKVQKQRNLALYIKRLYYDSNANILYLTYKEMVFLCIDELGEITVDTERGETYPPLKAMNEDRYAERCGYANAQKCIFCIAGNQKVKS